MKLRRIVSLSLMLSFTLMLVSSIMLYIVPQGRVAYWAGYSIWGLSKSQWGAIHTNLGLIMLIAGGFHIYYNWRPMTLYLKNKTREFKLFTPNFNVALSIIALFTVLTIMELPPAVWVQDLRATIEEGSASDLGEPPYGHAEESSLQVFLRNVNMDKDLAKANLEAAGIEVTDPQIPIIELATENGMTPQSLYEIIKGPQDQRSTTPLPIPTSMPRGSGRLTLAEFCQQHNRDITEALAILEAAGLVVQPELSLKDNAANNNLEALELLDVLREGFRK